MTKKVPEKPKSDSASTEGKPCGMADYLVRLKESEPTAPSKQRAVLFHKGVSKTADFQNRFRTWLREQGLENKVAQIGAPMVFPVVRLTCTPEVAERLEKWGEVESVSRDVEDIKFTT